MLRWQHANCAPSFSQTTQSRERRHFQERDEGQRAPAFSWSHARTNTHKKQINFVSRWDASHSISAAGPIINRIYSWQNRRAADWLAMFLARRYFALKEKKKKNGTIKICCKTAIIFSSCRGFHLQIHGSPANSNKKKKAARTYAFLTTVFTCVFLFSLFKGTMKRHYETCAQTAVPALHKHTSLMVQHGWSLIVVSGVFELQVIHFEFLHLSFNIFIWKSDNFCLKFKSLFEYILIFCLYGYYIESCAGFV